MGLDVYLHRYEHYEASRKMRDEYERRSNEIYETAKDGDGAEARTARQEKCAALRTELGLNKDGDYPGDSQVEQPSAIDPQHLFKVGYLRSSYNGGGINSVLRNLLGPGHDLYAIFARTDDGLYEFAPDWYAAQERVKEVIAKLEAKVASGLALFAEFISDNPFRRVAVADPHDAIKLATGEVTRWNDEKAKREGKPDIWCGGSYGNASGNYYVDEPLPVVAAIPGVGSFDKRPGVYLVYRAGDMAWYITALRITLETIEHVLNSGEPDKYRLHWSA